VLLRFILSPKVAPPSVEALKKCSTVKLQIILKVQYNPYQAMASSAQEQQKNKQVVRQFFEAADRQDIEEMGELVSNTNYFFHFPGIPPMDWNTHKQFFIAFTGSFPDLHHEIVDLVAEGDKVAVRFNVTGTHKGELQGIPPTGKKVSFGAMDFITLMDGKITEDWLSVDMMGLMQQIGAIPANPHATSTTGSSMAGS
jgi:steroid delta-isomerase-like uncharacterized protein